jgi:hypothetical protein
VSLRAALFVVVFSCLACSDAAPPADVGSDAAGDAQGAADVVDAPDASGVQCGASMCAPAQACIEGLGNCSGVDAGPCTPGAPTCIDLPAACQGTATCECLGDPCNGNGQCVPSGDRYFRCMAA